MNEILTFKRAGLFCLVDCVSSSFVIWEVFSSSFQRIYTRIFLWSILSSNEMVSVIGWLNSSNVIFSPSSWEYPVATKSVTELFSFAETLISYWKDTSTSEKSKF